MAATKEAPTKKELSAEEQLALANARIAELEASQPKPVAAPEPKPVRLAAMRADGTGGEVIQDVTDWLNEGCPNCHQPIHTDTPVYQPGLPGLYPALLFHYGTQHPGQTPPPAPHPDDDKALDSLVTVGLVMIGDKSAPRRIPYRMAIAEQVELWKAGVR